MSHGARLLWDLIPESIPLLLQLAKPGSRDEVLERVAVESGIARDRLGAIFDALQRGGILRSTDGGLRANQSAGYSYVFGSLLAHRHMLRDYHRTQTFQRAIEAVVERGHTVIDVGSGSGILSLFAARAGAAKVYGLEITSIVDDARKLAHANGLADKVEFVHGDAAAFDVQPKVDLVVGEWLSTFAIDEWRHFEAFAEVRDRCLKPAGKVMPRRLNLFIAPINDESLAIRLGLQIWARPVFGFDFRLGLEHQLQKLEWITVRVDPNSLVAEPAEVLDLDCAQATSRDYFFSKRVEFAIRQTASINGIAGYFTAELAPGVVLDTSPFGPSTTFSQLYLVIEPFTAQPGDHLVLEMATREDSATGDPVIRLQIWLHRGAAIVWERAYEYVDRVSVRPVYIP